MLLENEWSIHIKDGEDSYLLQTQLGERVYWPDLMAWHDGLGWVIFEVDGKRGHTTRMDLYKMELRDHAFQKTGIRTVRIQTADLVGKKKQPVDIILAEIDYQLS